MSRRKDQAEIDAQNARDLAEIAASLDALDLEHGLAPAPELRKKVNQRDAFSHMPAPLPESTREPETAAAA